MLREIVLGAKVNSPTLKRQVNLTVAHPIDKNDTDFGASDILLAKDVAVIASGGDTEKIEKEVEEIICKLTKALSDILDLKRTTAEMAVSLVSVITDLRTALEDIAELQSHFSTDLSMVDIYGEALSAQSTANCYVVTKAGSYKFPLVYGNAIKDGTTNSAAYTKTSTGTYFVDYVNAYGNQITSPYIETDTGKTCAEAQFTIGDADIFTDISISDGYLNFKVSEVPTGGANGVLSVKDSDGTIMWNWHIWVFPYDLTPVTITNNVDIKFNILPVFLATTYDEGDNLKRKNWFYQWGRSVPMLGPSAYDSTTQATSYGALAFTTQANSSGPYQQGITSPTTFWSASNDQTKCYWFGSAPSFNLWGAYSKNPYDESTAEHVSTTKTVYDPSPVGFKVEQYDVFGWGVTTVDTVGSFANGWYIKKNSKDTTGIFFPASGYMYPTGAITSTGSLGAVASSSPASKASVYSFVYSSSVKNPIQQTLMRAYGLSICCVKE